MLEDLLTKATENLPGASGGPERLRGQRQSGVRLGFWGGTELRAAGGGVGSRLHPRVGWEIEFSCLDYNFSTALVPSLKKL